MRSICLINNYNYGRYLHECLAGALTQTAGFDAIVVVDDGSTDDSRSILEELGARHTHLEVVFKSNGGQLSCFHAALPYVGDDDVVVLCDADDVLPPDYLERLLPRYTTRATDLSFCEMREFSTPGDPLLAKALDSEQEDVALPCTSALARRCKWWFCAPTSCIALTGRLYRELFPYPFEADWRISADKVIGFGASLLGARKLYIPSLKIGYRVHGANHSYGRTRSPQDEVQREHRLERLFGWYCSRQHISTEASVKVALAEYRLLPAAFKARFNMRDSKALLQGRRLLLFKLRRLLGLRQ
jgi:glycosyltransferase involved in cell wall biosynthesis